MQFLWRSSCTARCSMLIPSSPLKWLLSLRYTELDESVILVRGSFIHKHAPIYPDTVSKIYSASILVRFERSVRQRHSRRVHMRMLLITHAHAIHVHRNRNDDLWLVRRVATAAAGGATAASMDDAGLHPLPFGSSVLKPDFHLHFSQAQLLRDLRPFRQRKVFLAVELFLELEQLFTRERRPPAPTLCFAAVRHAPATRGAVVVVVAARVRSPARAIRQLSLPSLVESRSVGDRPCPVHSCRNRTADRCHPRPL